MPPNRSDYEISYPSLYVFRVNSQEMLRAETTFRPGAESSTRPVLPPSQVKKMLSRTRLSAFIGPQAPLEPIWRSDLNWTWQHEGWTLECQPSSSVGSGQLGCGEIGVRITTARQCFQPSALGSVANRAMTSIIQHESRVEVRIANKWARRRAGSVRPDSAVKAADLLSG
jgi:hypothetical protein